MKMYQVERFNMGAYALMLVLFCWFPYTVASGNPIALNPEKLIRSKTIKKNDLRKRAIINNAYKTYKEQLHQEHLAREMQAELYTDRNALLIEALHYHQVKDPARQEKFTFLAMLVDPKLRTNDLVTIKAIAKIADKSLSETVKQRAFERIEKDASRNQPHALLFLGERYNNDPDKKGLARFYFTQAKQYAGDKPEYAEVVSFAQQRLATFAKPTKI